MTESNKNEDINLAAGIEALLFVAGEPVTLQQMASALDVDVKKVEIELRALMDRYQLSSGLAIQENRGKYQLTTSPSQAVLVERFLGLETTSKLSQAALETLTIICYRQPVTRPGIDAIRGVSSDGVLRALVSKGLVEEVGRSEGPGRPILYATTNDFLQHFGLNSIDELPPYKNEDDVEDEKIQLLKD